MLRLLVLLCCRNLTSTGGILLANVRLLLPPAEAAQLAAAAALAVAAAGGNADQALLSMVCPTAAGPLAVLYRSVQISNAPAAAAAAGDASRQHLLQIAGASTADVFDSQKVGVSKSVGSGSIIAGDGAVWQECLLRKKQQAGDALPPGVLFSCFLSPICADIACAMPAM
jgi:hypothetical protein